MSGGRAILALGDGRPCLAARARDLRDPVPLRRRPGRPARGDARRPARPLRGPRVARRRPRAAADRAAPAAGRARAVGGRALRRRGGDRRADGRRLERVGSGRETFAAKARLPARARARAATYAPTWGGIALVGEDAERPRPSRGSARASAGCRWTGVWTGTTADLRAFAAALGDAGRGVVRRAAGGSADRLDVIAADPRAREQRRAQAGEARRAARGPRGARCVIPPNARRRIRTRRGPLLALPSWSRRATVMAFWSFGSEVATRAPDRAPARRGASAWRCRGSAIGTSRPRTWRPGEPRDRDVRSARGSRRAGGSLPQALT